MANTRKYHPKLFNIFNVANNITSTQLLNWRENLIDVWNWFLWCGNEIQVLSHIFSKKSTSYAVTPEVTEINNRKYQKTTSCIFSQRTIMIQNSWKRKSLKKLQVQTRVKNYFSFLIFYAEQRCWNVREKRWGKQSYLATSREDITILAYCFTDSLCSREYTPIDYT